MKKYIKLFIVLVFSICLFTSCLDEKPVFEENPKQGIVELDLLARTTVVQYASKPITVDTNDGFEIPVTVNYTGVNGTPDDVQVTLEIVNEIVSIYDASGATIALSSDLYELPASNVVTIPKGQKTAVYGIRLKAGALEASKRYAIGVKISASTGGIISGNYSEGVYLLSLQN